jgi:hypothetical protein
MPSSVAKDQIGSSTRVGLFDDAGGFVDELVRLPYEKVCRLSELAGPRVPGSGKI